MPNFVVLAGMAPANRALHTPGQVQKLFFLIDRNIGDLIGGRHFDFRSYGYGPFDRAVYDVLRELSVEGLVDILPVRTWREYRLTETGQERGEAILSQLPQKAQNYIKRMSKFVRGLSFTQLVSAIYKAYPEMRTNSVFQNSTCQIVNFL